MREVLRAGQSDRWKGIPTLKLASGLRAGVDFGVGYFPEFLRESTAIEDYYDPGLIVFGALDPRTAGAARPRRWRCWRRPGRWWIPRESNCWPK